MKKIKIITIFLAVVLLFSSCDFNRAELKDRLVIQGIGVDGEEGEYTVTLQVLSNGQGMSEDESEPKSVDIVELKGKTIAQAVSSVTSVTGRVPLFSQNRIIIFGKPVGEKNTLNILDFFSREYTARINVPVVIAEKTASEILKADAQNGEIGSKALVEMLESGREEGICVKSPVYKLINSFREKTTSAVIPIFKITEKGKNQSKTVCIGGSAVYSRADLSCYLTIKETLMLNFLVGNTDKGIISFNVKGVPVTVQVINSKIKTDYSVNNGFPDFYTRIKLRVDILEYGKGDAVTEEVLDEIKAEANEYIKNSCISLVKKLTEKKLDPMRLGRLVAVKNPKLYFDVENTFNEKMNISHFNIKVDTVIRRIGQNSIRKK